MRALLKTRWSFLALVAVSACGPDPAPEELVLDWLDGSVVVRGAIEEGILRGKELLRPWNEGLAVPVEADSVVWTLGESASLQFESLGQGDRELVLEAKAADGGSVPLRLSMNGDLVAERVFGARERVVFALPESASGSGLHRLELSWPASAGDPAIGLYAAGIRLAGHAPTRGEERWRWSPLVEGSSLELAGSTAAELSLEVYVDPGGGAWRRVWSRELAGAERFDESIDLGDEGGEGLARVAVRAEGGAIRWELLRQRLTPAERLDRRNIVLLSLDTTRWDALGAYRKLADGPADYGIEGSPTPHLDELAERSTIWEQALSPAPVTGPTHASLFLSQPPRAHGLDRNGKNLPRAPRGLFPAYLEAWGYRNAGFISLGVLKRDLGFAQGFEHYSDDIGPLWHRPAHRVQESLRAWLDEEPERPGQPRLLWLHYSDPHMPYGPPHTGGALMSWDEREPVRLDGTGRGDRFVFVDEPGTHRIRFEAPPDAAPGREWKLLRFRLSDESIEWSFGQGFREGDDVLLLRSGAEIFVELPEGGAPGIRLEVGVEDALSDVEQRQRYAADVRTMDDAVGESVAWLRARGWLDDALICVFADHGEDIGGEDGRWGHVEHVRPSLSRIPLFLVDTRRRAGIREEPAGIVDLAPTLAARLGLPGLPSWAGADLFAGERDRALHLESLPPEAAQNWRALVRGPYKLEGPVDEAGELVGSLKLFHLLDDPLCRNDLLREGASNSPDDDERSALVREWTRWVSGDSADGGIDPRMEERLRALGYLD